MKFLLLNLSKIKSSFFFRYIKFSAFIIFYCISLEAHEHVLEANHGGRNYYYSLLLETPGDVLIGSFKLNPRLMPDLELIQILKKREQSNSTKILLEERLTAEEIRGEIPYSADASLQKFNQTPGKTLANLHPYDNVHVKVLLTSKVALIGTTNYDGICKDCISRDFTAVIENPLLLQELHEIFSQIEKGLSVNWNIYFYHVKNIEESSTRLTWGPKQHYTHLLEIIALAEHDISIYQQDLQDMGIVKALEGKLRQGLEVRILMSHHPFGKENPNKSLPNLKRLAKAGAKVRLTGHKPIQDNLPLHIHAKVVLIDRETNPLMYLGSANFYPPVLNPEARNLNLGIITRAKNYIALVKNYFEQDWASHSDQYLKIDL